MKPAVCTIATTPAAADLRVFLSTLELFNFPVPTVYLLCDSAIHESPPQYKGILKTSPALDKYKNHNRAQMEMTRGNAYKTMWEDFMMEKATVMELAFKEPQTSGVFFCDSDICFMGPLPQPTCEIGVCPHMIKPADEQRFGKYNAGFVYTTDSTFPEKWRTAAKTSRYYDQAALEDIVAATPPTSVYEFPVQTNYGWWRMFQGTKAPQELVNQWSIFRRENHSGICVSGEPLLSVHTHFAETRDPATREFNRVVFLYLCRLGKHAPAASLVKILTREFQHLKSLKN
jgi:hypothetical protein